MKHHHLDRRLLRAILDGELKPSEMVALLILHLDEVCPVCRAELEAWTAEREGSMTEVVNDLVSEELLRALDEERSWIRTLRPRAEQELRELMRLDTGDRREKVGRAIKRFRNPLLIDLLLERSRKLVRIDPNEAREVAELALEVALRLPDRYGSDVLQSSLARANAFRANAFRVAGDLRAADEILQQVLDYLDLLPDPLLRAEIWNFAAALRKDQQRFAEAEELLQRTLDVYWELGSPDQQCRMLLSQASLAYRRDRLDEAVRLLQTTVTVLPEASDRRLEFFVQHNLAWYLCEAGRFAEAREIKDAQRELYAGLSEPLLQCRGDWLDGKIAGGLGESEVAEAKLLQARKQFIEAGIGFDAALVSLDLASLYMHQGRSADVKRLAEEMLPIFRAQDIHREAFASLLLFHKAAQAEKLNLGMVRDLASYLERARDQRALHHQEPS